MNVQDDHDGGEGKVMLQLMMMNLKVMLLLRLLASVQRGFQLLRRLYVPAHRCILGSCVSLCKDLSARNPHVLNMKLVCPS